MSNSTCTTAALPRSFINTPAAGSRRFDVLLADLGFASNQMDEADRGFSFTRDGPLDMRLDPTSGQPASELVASLPEAELADLIYRFGEERLSRRIARRIVEQRRAEPITTTHQLAEICRRCCPPPHAGLGRGGGKGRRGRPRGGGEGRRGRGGREGGGDPPRDTDVPGAAHRGQRRAGRARQPARRPAAGHGTRRAGRGSSASTRWRIGRSSGRFWRCSRRGWATG